MSIRLHHLIKYYLDAYGRGVDPNALMITSGNSQAISHAAILFSKHRKLAFVEDPTYFLAFDIFNELGLSLESIPVDEHGLDV